MSTLDAAQQNEVVAPSYHRADFVRIYKASPAIDLAFTTHDHDISIGGVNYVAGVLDDFSGLRVAPDRKAQRISLRLMAADDSLRAAIEDDIHFARLTYSLAVLTEDGAVITGLIPIAAALVSQPVLMITEQGAMLELQCESETARFLRPRRIIAGDADQQWRFAGDVGLELVPRVPRSQAEWGGSVQSPGGGGGRGTGGASGQRVFTANLH